MQNGSLGKSFYSLSFSFQKVSNFTQFHTTNQTSNHTNNQNYLISITFQNLEFWDVTIEKASAVKEVTNILQETMEEEIETL